MKRVPIEIVTKKGKKSTVFVVIDEQTEKVLNELNDENYKLQYLHEEYRMQERDKWHKRRTVSLERIIDENLEPCTEKDVLERNLEAEERKSEVIRAIGTLSEEQQEIINLYYFENKTQEQIAQILGVCRTTIRKKLKKAYTQIKNILENLDKNGAILPFISPI